jgi:predicted RNA binding protein YcfA (HicA-like mRNA interferase family)
MNDFASAVKDILRRYGCEFVRRVKGDHDIWKSPVNGKSFPVDSKIKSRHTANGILKQAGLPKAF